MIRIDLATQSFNGNLVRTSRDSPSSTFADLLARQIAEVAEADKSRQPLTSDDHLTSSEASNSRDELMRFLSMSPIELIRYQTLEKMGLTEEALEELPFEERMEIEGKIQEKIDQVIGAKAGREGIAVKA
jgi:hypothetical protein